jgi:hypothetical protein
MFGKVSPQKVLGDQNINIEDSCLLGYDAVTGQVVLDILNDCIAVKTLGITCPMKWHHIP